MTSLTSSELTASELQISTSGLDTVEETLAADATLAETLARPYPAREDFEGWRQLRESGPLGSRPLDQPNIQESQIAGVPVRLIEHQQPLGSYLHFHGGGWSMGSHRSQDERLLELSNATGLTVISVGYRLAPEHSIREVIADCLAVSREVLGSTALPVAIGGESAGAHLAVCTLLGLQKAGLPALVGAVLTYGLYDFAGTPGRRFSNPRYEQLIETVAPENEVPDLRAPWLSPLYAPLDDLPPARFMVGSRDALLEDSLFLAARWQLQAPIELDIVAGAAHAFTLLDTATTRAAREREYDFLRGIIGGKAR
ncbi:alpha/beta hydrolase [Psychromicrobium lacuslunae]|uniref:alpha/beta hydrolase n=1 Tax=Psychromicrobium lacuslunae TaxID=1618207 RepID=UPI0006960188|nr:alpha/beta hydrolase fold domain-containing protein [Psychromicrobium lacuslunae]